MSLFHRHQKEAKDIKKLFFLIFIFCFIALNLIFGWEGVQAAVSLQDLIEQAKPGSTLEIPAGTYAGNFSITKSLILKGQGTVILDGQKNGTILSIRAPDIHISGLIIRNSGTALGAEDSCVKVEDAKNFSLSHSTLDHCLFGIEILNSPQSKVHNCHVQGYPLSLARRGDLLKTWYSPSLKLTDNKFSQGRDVVIWYSPGSILKNNHMAGSRYGMHFMYSNQTTAHSNTIIDNSVGIYGMYSHGLHIVNNKIFHNRGPSGFGIALKESNEFIIKHNFISSNRVGIYSDNSPMVGMIDEAKPAWIEQNRISFNDIGASFIGRSTGASYLKNDFIDNWQQVGVISTERIEAKWEMNYWSDYAGIDIEGNGFGVIPYHLSHLTDMLTDRYEGFKIFNFGPAMLALEFASRAIPWLKPNPKATDPSPSMHQWTSLKKESASYFIFLICFVFLAISWGLNKVMYL